MTHIFENPWLMLTIAAVALVPAAIVRQARPEWGYRPLLIPLAIAALGFALDWAVQTDSEKIHTIIRDCRRAAIQEDLRPVAEVLCLRRDDDGRLREAFITSANRALQGAALDKVRFRNILLEIEPPRAVAEIDAVVHLDAQSSYAAYGTLMFVSLRVEFSKQPDETWCIRGVDIASVNNQPVNWGYTF